LPSQVRTWCSPTAIPGGTWGIWAVGIRSRTSGLAHAEQSYKSEDLCPS
jgi:hypothetical protein